ncbi:hypothetical protein GCK72_012743 [Caenorhabditis remanei]|uniref:Uncharacterized protein n=1 Tax=Caenorhabditis remanei TaxID=31234 RepID=A0A6A5GLT6_CAERE|nr:hypothetical protein GCK72_012743 [Caenorhabditis remanei]KAF1756290.1 hypothetical protein GCK72_012743 [Caenorhabditis remanei]
MSTSTTSSPVKPETEQHQAEKENAEISPSKTDESKEEPKNASTDTEVTPKLSKKDKKRQDEVAKMSKQLDNHGTHIKSIEGALSLTASTVDEVTARLAQSEEEIASLKEDVEILETRVRTDTITAANHALVLTRISHIEIMLASLKRKPPLQEGAGPSKIAKSMSPSETGVKPASRPEDSTICTLCDGAHVMNDCALFPTALSKLNEFKKKGRCLKCAQLGCSGRSQCPNSVKTCTKCQDRQSPPSCYHLPIVCLYDEIFVKRQRDKKERERRAKMMETPAKSEQPQPSQQVQQQQTAPQQMHQQQQPQQQMQQQQQLPQFQAPSQQYYQQPHQPAQPVFAMPRVPQQQMMPQPMMYQQQHHQQFQQPNPQGFNPTPQQPYGCYTQY